MQNHTGSTPFDFINVINDEQVCAWEITNIFPRSLGPSKVSAYFAEFVPNETMHRLAFKFNKF